MTAIHVRDAFLPDVEARAQHPARLRRIELGLTQRQLARSAKIGVRTLLGIERGENLPQMDTRRRLCRVLGYPFAMHRIVFGPLVNGGTRAEATRGGVAAARGAKC